MNRNRSICLFAFLVLALQPGSVRAQWDAVGGGVLGAAGGVLVTHAWITAEAKAGHFMFGPSDGLTRAIPVPVGLVAGAWLGAENSDRLWRSVGHGAIGAVVGGVTGLVIGEFVWDDREGRWAGAVLGSAVGLLAGTISGAASWSADAEPVPLFQIRLGVGR